MDFFPAIWNVLHDGSIVGASGEVPGTVRLDISIEYLRERFADPGEFIQITLIGCTRFAYREFGEQEFTTNLAAIAELAPEVLNAGLLDGLWNVECVKGVLKVAAIDGALHLDSGRAITLQELIDAADAYWAEWSAKNSPK